MKLTERSDGNAKVFSIAGRLDVYNVSEVKASILNALGSGSRCLVVDMKEVEFIDSSGIGALVVCLKKAGEKHGKLAIARLGEEVRSMFEITRTDRLFEIHKSVEDAIAAFTEVAGGASPPRRPPHRN